MSKEHYPTEEEIIEFYSEIVRCPIRECNEHGASNQPNGKYCRIPRSFCGDYITHKKILIVANMPGRLTDLEKVEYRKIHPKTKNSFNDITKEESIALAKAHIKIAMNMFHEGIDYDENTREFAFHRDLNEAVTHVLRIKPDEMFKYVYYTNLVKCQTYYPYSYTKASQRKFLARKCYNTHLKREIAFLKPDLIFTYGEEVIKNLSLRELIPIKVFNLPKIWSGASDRQRKKWRDSLDVVTNNLDVIIDNIKLKMIKEKKETTINTIEQL